jgi:hypothetical protein
MTLPVRIANHVHISERETAHRWPDGSYDDAKWEDCTWDSALEYVRSVGVKAPATHAEAELLRHEVKGPAGGSNPTEVQTAVKKRYNLNITILRGFAAMWEKLVPGTVACVTLSMGAFPAGHRLRRLSPRFAGAHSVTIFRIDARDRVWWCDPLGPTVGYHGEWVTKAELKKAIDALPFNGHYVGRIAATLAAKPPVAPPAPKPSKVTPIESSCARAFLVKIGAPETTDMIRAVTAWFRQESGSVAKVIDFNAFNVRPGAADSISTGVRPGNFLKFRNLTAGFLAAAMVLVDLSPRFGYGTVLLRARRGNDPLGFLAALAASSWSASHYGWAAGKDGRTAAGNHLVSVYDGLTL